MRALLLVLLVLVVPGVVQGLEVRTLNGPVVGEERQETDPRTGLQVRWTQYLNIPYAAAPVGERRFRPPSKPDPWLEPLHSSGLQQNLTICPQLGGPGGGLYGRSDEDCLYLHLAVPQSPPSLLPVMVWIYGGGYSVGSATWADYGPQKFLDTDQVPSSPLQMLPGVIS